MVGAPTSLLSSGSGMSLLTVHLDVLSIIVTFLSPHDALSRAAHALHDIAQRRALSVLLILRKPQSLIGAEVPRCWDISGQS